MGSEIFIKIFIALITMNAISLSLGGRATPAIADNLKHLCSLTAKTTECWKIIEPQLSKFKSVERKAVAAAVIDLVKTRDDEIREQLKKLQRTSKDKELKGKYMSCSTTYNDVGLYLVEAERYLKSNDYQKLSFTEYDVIENSESCRHEFEWIKFDPDHFKDTVKEFGVYLNIFKVAVELALP